MNRNSSNEMSRPFEYLFFADPGELARAAANAWLDEIERANRAGKTHCVALSGGRIALDFFTAAVEQARRRSVSFDRVHFFWADERCVPPSDPESNFKLANELLLAPLQIPEDRVHRLRGEEAPEAAVKTAGAELRRVTGGAALDLIFLGMGEDGHVASLFPGAPAGTGGDEGPFLFVDHSPKPPPRRISMSYGAIAAAQGVWVLVSGPGKEAAFRESLKPDGRTPLARVLRLHPGTKIFSNLGLD